MKILNLYSGIGGNRKHWGDFFDMDVLELFAGSRSVGKAAKKMGLNVFSSDLIQFGEIDLVKSILDISKTDFNFYPKLIWASPPCTTFSMAAVGHHRDKTKPKTESAKIGDKIVLKTIEIIKEWFPKSVFFIENPRAMLRKMPYMVNIPRTTVCYCKYGAKTMKPTDIFSNNIKDLFNPNGWAPRAMCKNNNPFCTHEKSPRGSRSGIQGLKNNFERSKIPESLVFEILKSVNF